MTNGDPKLPSSISLVSQGSKAPPKAPIKRTNHKRGVKRASMDASIINQAQKRLDCSVPELANRIGVSSASLNEYLKSGQCPLPIGLALLYRMSEVPRSADEAPKEFLWLCRISADQDGATLNYEPLDVGTEEHNFNGQRFLLYPLK